LFITDEDFYAVDEILNDPGRVRSDFDKYRNLENRAGLSKLME